MAAVVLLEATILGAGELGLELGLSAGAPGGGDCRGCSATVHVTRTRRRLVSAQRCRPEESESKGRGKQCPRREVGALLALSVALSRSPCGPLPSHSGSRELRPKLRVLQRLLCFATEFRTSEPARTSVYAGEGTTTIWSWSNTSWEFNQSERQLTLTGLLRCWRPGAGERAAIGIR